MARTTVAIIISFLLASEIISFLFLFAHFLILILPLTLLLALQVSFATSAVIIVLIEVVKANKVSFI